MSCTCITTVDEKLKTLGCALDTAFVLNPTTLNLEPRRVRIATRRIDGKKKKPTPLTAAFCPFCW